MIISRRTPRANPIDPFPPRDAERFVQGAELLSRVIAYRDVPFYFAPCKSRPGLNRMQKLFNCAWLAAQHTSHACCCNYRPGELTFASIRLIPSSPLLSAGGCIFYAADRGSRAPGNRRGTARIISAAVKRNSFRHDARIFCRRPRGRSEMALGYLRTVQVVTGIRWN